MAKLPGKFAFRKHSSLGATAAEEDREFLEDCFVDTGDLELLQDCDDPRCIVLGRTGAGKTALLSKLANVEERVIKIAPEALSLAYISNSTILQFVEGLGVRLDLFYKLLWRHVFTVELIKARYQIRSEATKKTVLHQLYSRFSGDKAKQQALDYLASWGEHFWEETEYRIKEVTTKLESDISTALRGTVPSAGIRAEATKKLSEEQRAEVVNRTQRIVNSVQIKELNQALELLRDVFDNPQQRFYLVVDGLDENWAEDTIRYRLIRALIETLRDFYQVPNVKIIIAIRTDLLERVFRLTRDPGFQEEKYESLYVPLTWSREQLIELLDTRIDKLVKSQYTTQKVTHRDILPKQVRKVDAIDYILERTFYRPRDVIQFFNMCIRYAVNQPVITSPNVLDAEGEYSRDRLKSLQDEWYAEMPSLLGFANLLKRSHNRFRLGEINSEEVEEFCLTFLTDEATERLDSDALVITAKRFINDLDAVQFRREVAHHLYRVGMVGLKVEGYMPVSWSFSHRRSVSVAEITDDTLVEIHQAFWRALGIREVA